MTKLPKKILCLDWDRRSLRMVLTRGRGASMALEEAHSHRIPPAVDPDDPKAMGEFLARMLERHRWHQKRVVLNVPRERAVINTLSMPPTPPDELAAAVRFAALKELPFPIDEAVIDFAVTARDGKNVTQVLLSAVRKEALDRLLETCQTAALTPIRVGLRPYANVRSVLRAHDAGERRVLFVDVGPLLTEIDIIRGGTLAFSRSANVAVPMPHGAVVTDDSRISSKAEMEEVAASDEASDEAVDALLVEITRTMQAYRAADPNAAIDEIIVAGGTGIETMLATGAARRFNMPARLFDPTGALGVGRERNTELRSFSAALGLGWGLDDGQLDIDFLNPKRPIPPRQSLKRKLRVGAVAAAMVLAVGASAGVWNYGKKSAELQQLNAQVEQLAARLRGQHGRGPDVTGLLELKNYSEEVDEWAREGVWLDNLLSMTQHAIDPGEKMRVARVDFTRAKGTVSMKVLAMDSSIPSEFVKNLNSVEQGGKKVYRALTKAWRPLSGSDKFKGTVDIEIDLLDLQEFDSLAKKRADERRSRLRDVLRTTPAAAGGRS